MSIPSTPTHSSGTIKVVALDDLRAALAPIRDQLLKHPLYHTVDSLPRLRLFMGDHVFAVWDFMCLAKRLQRDLTSIQEIWLPPARPSFARFINSVILGEESDLDPEGQAASHFGLYLAAMEEVGASIAPIQRFIGLLRDGADVRSSLSAAGASPGVQQFVSHTLQTVAKATTIEVLASFLYGREDLIPEMFSRLQLQWGGSRQARRFAYYVNRHIMIDSEEHGPAGLQALAELAGQSAAIWQAAKQAAQAAIAARIALWDSVYVSLTDA